jgi:RNA polymerase sigma-70 factor (ECF subfamily)
MDELELIAGCKRGELWARKKIYELYASAMMSVCMRYINNKETAKDLLQDGFIKVFTKIDTYSGFGSFKGWIRRVFVTTALEYLRRNDALRVSSDIDGFNDTIENMEASVVDQLSADDILACIAELPNGYRIVFNLYAIEGYSHSEIADMLNINESTSRSQFIRARKVLQRNVESLIMHENARQRKI